VGNTLQYLSRKPPVTVHPHLRGEYATDPVNLVTDAGSPPPAWGIQHDQDGYKTKLRFTPTCVGNTSFNLSAILSSAVHPHLRGEYVFFLSAT